MDNRLVSLEVENFRSLRDVTLPLGPVTVLAGPNGAGKTNVLKVFDFLADIVRTDLEPALDAQGGFDAVMFHGGEDEQREIRIHARSATVKYGLRITNTTSGLSHAEEFSVDGDTRITVEQSTLRVDGDHLVNINPQSSGLSTLPRLIGEDGSVDGSKFARQLGSLRNFDVSVPAARSPSRISSRGLANDASNLASFLFRLREDRQLWQQLVDDACFVLPQLDSIDVETIISDSNEVGVFLRERGMRRRIPLTHASYGTVRTLGMLAMLYDPDPPTLTCVEEIENGLHPQALELLVNRIREASERTQFLIATHSPILVDRLRLDEFVACERNEDGSSAIPAISTSKIEQIVEASEGLPLGELWFSGVLGGDL